MRDLAAIETRIQELAQAAEAASAAAELLALGEEILEHWVAARGETPTRERREGFRLLALHRQGARGEPSFNACRETCRELVYHHNLITMEPSHPEARRRLVMASLVATHLLLFVAGKMEVAGLGEFCCSSKPLHAAAG
ncbi:MAG: hypothetical protein QGI63_01475 [Rhodospirillales bacterium]|nr:hypothetical protein [Rhodospirillales bacterium]MDP6772915.1 hypothetical protein [Rhodospirillales bacterium]